MIRAAGPLYIWAGLPYIWGGDDNTRPPPRRHDIWILRILSKYVRPFANAGPWPRCHARRPPWRRMNESMPFRRAAAASFRAV